MGETNEVMQQMNMAADEADAALVTLMGQMTSEQKAGALKVMTWLSANYMKAGYKRLSKILVATAKGQ
jgi:hypothetical protein